MEEQKLLRRKKKAINSSNRRVLAEACNDLATFYFKVGSYEDALKEYKYEASIYKDMGLRMEWATSNRMVAEVYMLLAEFEKALHYEEKHLVVSKEMSDLVEEQRAMATIGRIHLLKAQSVTDTVISNKSLTAAEKAFMKSLMLCERLKGKIKICELMDMRARLLLNIGVVLENMDMYDKALECIHKAVKISSSQDLYEVLHLCYKSEGLLYSSRMNDYGKALCCFNKALEVSSRLEDKEAKLCEILLLKSDILCKMSDYQSAKQVLTKAWKLKTPDQNERENIERNLRIVATICYTEDLLITTNPTDNKSFKSLYEKLGDSMCALSNYQDGIKNYLKMLEYAKLAGDSGKDLIPIYVSLYQTYKDIGDVTSALEYYEKEYELIKNIPKEAYTTLCNIAEALFVAKRPYNQIEKACLDAREEAKKCFNKKYEIRILKYLLKYQIDCGEDDKLDQTKEELSKLGIDDYDIPDISDQDDDDICSGGNDNDMEIGADICLNDLTDVSDNDEENVPVVKKMFCLRKRGKGYVVKKNMKGETQLHQACISGNKLLVERLIGRGHPINVRDNAGWLPIHEACIHGHLDIVKILVTNGATVNDRGGSNCDGITPIYDAASNGHIDIVDYLLQHGAIPSLKTDYGETTLQVLQKWRSSQILTKQEQVQYNKVCEQINSYIEKNPNSITPIKNKISNYSPPSTSKENVLIEAVMRRRRAFESESEDNVESISLINNINEDSESSNDIPLFKSGKNKSVKEYRNVMLGLRAKNVIDDETDEEPKRSDKLPALMDPDEVGDDWLEDDMKNHKKRKSSNDLNRSGKRPLLENEINKNCENSRSVVIDSDNSTDSESFIHKNKSNLLTTLRKMSSTKDESLIKDSRKSIKKRYKTQSTLLKAGFKRQNPHEYSESSNNSSDCDVTSTIPLQNNFKGKINFIIAKRTMANETEPSLRRHKSNDSLQSNVQTRQVTPLGPPASVRVMIEDKTFLIPLKSETINDLTINWLVDQVKKRYHRICGVRPSIRLEMTDGAILSEEDPLSLVMGVNELKATISGIKPDPAEENYIQCCAALNISNDEEIQQAIGRTYKTFRFTLGTYTLPQTQIKPLFRALTHQNHITELILTDNNLNNDNIKSLIECLYTMRNVTTLDLSNNYITAEGVRFLLGMFERSKKPLCRGLVNIDLSLNPICDDGFRCVANLACHVELKSLKLFNCQITENAITETNDMPLHLESIESLDLGNNNIKLKLASHIVSHLSPSQLVELEIENIGVDGAIVGFLATFLESCPELKLKKLNLSKCGLIDSQFMRIYRTLLRAKHLQTISLKSNSLTFITLKKLLQRKPPIPNINLENCFNIFKYAQDSDFPIWLPAIDFGRTIPVINVTPASKTDEERESVKLFSKTWLNCFKGRGVIEHCDGNVIRFTCT